MINSDNKNLAMRAGRGALWLATGGAIEQGLRLVRNLVLTRILAPEAFGVLAIVLAVNQAFETFTEVGIQTAIIQNPRGQERTYLNGAWWLSLARAIMLYAIAFVSAPWIAAFYNHAELVPLMRVAFLAILFKAAMSPELHAAVKAMKFDRWTAAQQGGGVVGIIVALVLATITRNVWALAIGFIVEAAARCILSYVVCPFRPSLQVDRDHLTALLRYTRGIAGLPILTFLFTRTDVFVIGKLCSIDELGLYSMVAAIAQMPMQFVGNIIAPVTMPAFAEMQHDLSRVNRALASIIKTVALIGVPALIFVSVFGKNILELLYGAPYAAVSMPFAILTATSLLQILSVPVVTLYLAIGKPELHRKFAAFRMALLLALIYPAVSSFGLIGAAAAGLIAMIAGTIVQLHYLGKLTGFKLNTFALMNRKTAPPRATNGLTSIVQRIKAANG